MTYDDLDAYWERLREDLGDRLKATGSEHLEPVADELVDAMRTARRLRRMADEEPLARLASGRLLSNPLYVEADREARRAASLIRLLQLPDDDPLAPADAFGEPDGFDALDAETQFSEDPEEDRAIRLHARRMQREAGRPRSQRRSPGPPPGRPGSAGDGMNRRNGQGEGPDE